MTKIRLATGETLKCENVELIYGILKITTKEKTVEELAAIFSDKTKTASITILTDSDKEVGRKVGFTSFAGINFGKDGLKTIEIFQPENVTEKRIAIAEGNSVAAINDINAMKEKVENLEGSLEEAVTEITTAMAGAASYLI